jgi:hypothetical protein
MKSDSALKKMLSIEGLFYFVFGIWPIIDLTSFMVVTGLKFDTWLVVTVGWLLSLIGAVYLISSRENEISKSILTLAIGGPLVLAGIDIYYVQNLTISKVYLIDALIEFIFVLIWVFLLLKKRKKSLA